MTNTMMTINHDQWAEFFLALVGELDFREEGDKVLFDCDGGFTKSRKVLKAFPRINVNATLNEFSNGPAHAYCDCEIVFNVPAGKEITDHKTEKAVQKS